MFKIFLRFTLIFSLTPSFSFAAESAWYEKWTAKPAWPEKISFLTGSALTLTTMLFHRALIDDLQQDQSTRKPLGSWSKAGDLSGQGLPNALYAGAMGAAAWTGHAAAHEHSELMITATLQAVLTTTVLKYTVREKRPDSDKRDSFPSGHTTSAFAFASVVGAEHGWRWGLPAYALATFAGWSRINDNKHDLNDVVAGATIGISTGLGIYYAREERLGRQKATQVRLTPIPLDDGIKLFLSAYW